MSADEMANFHEHMIGFCQQQMTENPKEPTLLEIWRMRIREHTEAYQYWCAKVPK